MIVVKIVMWPGGDRNKEYPLATGVIYNDGQGTRGLGNYDWGLMLKTSRVWRTGTVENFPRKSKNVWYLLSRVLADL